MSILLSPLTIRDITFKNRIVISPMCQYSATDGFANDWHLVHLGSRAVGGAGLIIQEATAISPEGRISYGDLGIWKDAHIDSLKKIVSFLHSQGAKAGIQLAHAGRKASCEISWKGGQQISPDAHNGWQTYSASAEAFTENQHAPIAMTEDDIKGVIANFVAATLHAKEAGYDVVEIHAAHGYLLHQFYSPLSNKRTDAYGGSFDNRIKLLLEVTQAVKDVWTDKPLFVRISATDWTTDGWNINDSIALCTLLKDMGVDLIDVSSGGNIASAKIPAAPGYQVDFAESIKQNANVMTGAVGLITTAQQAEDILQKNQADMILIARESLRNPYFPLHAAKELQDEIAWPLQYVRAK